MTHILSCRTGGLFIARHNEIRDKLLYLSLRDFTSTSLCAKPLINKGHTGSEQEIRQGSDKYKETWGDVMVRGLWDYQVGAIIDVKLGDFDSDSYKYEPMAALLSRWETIKNDNHGKHGRDQRKHFSPFFSQWKEY